MGVCICVFENSLTFLSFLTGAEVTEPNISNRRGERMDLLVKQEEAAAGDGGFLSGERDEAVAQEREGSVANLRAALMSKNSLLSLGAEMLGEESQLLFDYLPKGGHSLSRKSHCGPLL